MAREIKPAGIGFAQELLVPDISDSP